LVDRPEWGAAPPTAPPRLGAVELAVVHHTATPWDAGPGPAAVRAICELHREGRGWDDLAYNFLIDRRGRVYEGRAGGPERAVVGAHTRGWNRRSTGIAVIGSYETEPPTAPALDALERLLAWKLRLHGLNPGEGTVLGHRDLESSSRCPGSALQAALPAIRERAGRIASGA
jgi:hypothetical protein